MGVKLPIGDISAAEVVWKYGESGEIILTPHLGKVSLKMTDSISDIEEEAQGDAAVDSVFGGTKMEFEVPMARSTMLQLQEALLAPAAGSVIPLVNKTGCPMYEDAHPVLIKPMCDGVADTDDSTWIWLYKAHPFRAFELGYDRKSQRTFLVKFKVFVSHESGYTNEFGQIGI